MKKTILALLIAGVAMSQTVASYASPVATSVATQATYFNVKSTKDLSGELEKAKTNIEKAVTYLTRDYGAEGNKSPLVTGFLSGVVPALTTEVGALVAVNSDKGDPDASLTSLVVANRILGNLLYNMDQDMPLPSAYNRTTNVSIELEKAKTNIEKAVTYLTRDYGAEGNKSPLVTGYLSGTVPPLTIEAGALVAVNSDKGDPGASLTSLVVANRILGNLLYNMDQDMPVQ